MLVTDHKGVNISKAHSMIREASANGCRLVVLPEMFNCPYTSKLFPEFAETYPGGETFKMLSATAREEGVYLVGGSVPEWENDVIYNTSFVFGPGGELLDRHRKLHLFDVDLPGGLSFRESKTIGRGEKVTVIQTAICTLGVAICYDIRFPELCRLMTLMGAELILLPAAFNMNTGPAHWELLLRARAVDNQVFVAAAAPARDPNASYVSYANSAVIDPWGNVLAHAGENETILYAEIDRHLIARTRESLPLLKHLRADLYQLKLLQ